MSLNRNAPEIFKSIDPHSTASASHQIPHPACVFARSRLLICAATFACALAGCATKPLVLAQSVGPKPSFPKSTSSEGQLVVYTAMDGFAIGDTSNEQHTSFKIFAVNGTLLKSVRNRTGIFEGDPTPVALAAGTYRIEARAANVGTVSIPVEIEANQSTVVFLDGITKPAAASGHEQDLVRLPTGTAIGWRAQKSIAAH
jgi:hypothetical protein